MTNIKFWVPSLKDTILGLTTINAKHKILETVNILHKLRKYSRINLLNDFYLTTEHRLSFWVFFLCSQYLFAWRWWSLYWYICYLVWLGKGITLVDSSLLWFSVWHCNTLRVYRFDVFAYKIDIEMVVGIMASAAHKHKRCATMFLTICRQRRAYFTKIQVKLYSQHQVYVSTYHSSHT